MRRRVEFEREEQDDRFLTHPNDMPDGPIREYVLARSKVRVRRTLTLADDRNERNCGNCGALATHNTGLVVDNISIAPTFDRMIVSGGRYCTWFGEDLYWDKRSAPEFGDDMKLIYALRCDACVEEENASLATDRGGDGEGQ